MAWVDRKAEFPMFVFLEWHKYKDLPEKNEQVWNVTVEFFRSKHLGECLLVRLCDAIPL